MNKQFTPPHRQQGVGLIEVLVTVLVLSIGILGIAALQTKALQNNQSSLQRSQAVMLSYFMLDSMRINRTVANAGGYNLGKTCTPVTDAGSLVTHDQRAWLQAIRNQLGDTGTSCGSIVCQASVCTITVFWDDSRGTAGNQAQSVTTVSRL